jgi:hypothetical protein
MYAFGAVVVNRLTTPSFDGSGTVAVCARLWREYNATVVRKEKVHINHKICAFGAVVNIAY